MINRAIVILRYKAPAVHWINDADPHEGDPQISMEDANRDRTVYLISEQDADDDKALARWIKANYAILFEAELDGWYRVESLWPQQRDLNLFYEWFEVECHTVIEDTVGTPIADDDI